MIESVCACVYTIFTSLSSLTLISRLFTFMKIYFHFDDAKNTKFTEILPRTKTKKKEATKYVEENTQNLKKQRNDVHAYWIL